MVIGVDFDNTIVSYDGVFHAIAVEEGLVPAEVPRTKEAVRNYLRRADREDEWTRLQGEVYGARMERAEPFPGVVEFMRDCARRGLELAIVSHKTLRPYAGPPYDLHASARAWLEQQGITGDAAAPVPPERVYFELTKEAKLERIGAAGCSFFIDDLAEFLAEPAFPPGVTRILFDPNASETAEALGALPGIERARSWDEVRSLVVDGSA